MRPSLHYPSSNRNLKYLQSNKTIKGYSVAICRSHDFLVSGLPHAGLGDDRGHLYRGVVTHPPLHHVLFGGQQLVQPPLPKRNSASLFSKYLDPIFIIMYISLILVRSLIYIYS